MRYADVCRHIESNSAAIEQCIHEATADDGVKAAIRATLKTIVKLFGVRSSKPWDSLKERCFVSFVKGTRTTSSSITAGIASKLLHPGESVAIVNCSKHVKLQIYCKDADGIVRTTPTRDSDEPVFSLAPESQAACSQAIRSMTASGDPTRRLVTNIATVPLALAFVCL